MKTFPLKFWIKRQFIFCLETTNLKLNLGMLLDSQEIVGNNTTVSGDICASLERPPLCTDSLSGLQRSIEYAQRFERNRNRKREFNLRYMNSSTIADKCNSILSQPFNLPLRTALSSNDLCCCSRKPPAFTITIVFINKCIYFHTQKERKTVNFIL